MKAVRTPLATALVVVVAMLNGCGLFFGTDPGPSAPRFDPPAGTYDEHQWVSIKNRDGQLYVTTNPAADVLEFKPMWDDESIYVGDDVTIRAYAIDDRGLRSAVSEAAYVIEDATAPVISSATIRQTYANYFGYDMEWDAWPADSSGDSNPSDDLTDWNNLEFVVYASPADNIGTIEEAESNGTLVRDWHSENTAGSVGYAYCTASHAGERRYINVFVRDEEGNVSAYGSVAMESRPAVDIYLAQSVPLGAADDEVWLNLLDGAFNPPPSPPPNVLVNTYAVAFVDLDDDRYDDLVTCYNDGVTTYQGWFKAIGNGTFDPVPQLFGVGTAVAYDIEIADLNQDGRPEILFANSSTNVIAYDLDLTVVCTLGVTKTDRLTAGDINGDGYPDIVTADKLEGEDVTVWINQNGNDFAELSQDWIGANYVTDPVDVLLTDLDGDGYSDLVVASLIDEVQVYYGTSDGSLEPGPVEPWVPEGTKCVAATDWDNDGWTDLIFGNDTNFVGEHTHIYFSDRNRGFVGPWDADTGSTTTTTGIAIGDLNGDGWPDFVETFLGSPFQIWLNNWAAGADYGYSGGSGDNALAVGRLR